MKEPRLVPPGRRRGSSSTGGLTLPLTSPFQAAGATAAVSPSSPGQLRSLGLSLAAASGVVLLLFCLFASSTSSSSRSREYRSERALPSLPGSEAARGISAAARSFHLPGMGGVGGVGVGGVAASSSSAAASAAAAALRLHSSSSNSSPSSPLPCPTLSPEDEAAFEADMISMLAGEEGEEGGEASDVVGVGGAATPPTTTTAASSASSDAAAATSDSTSSGVQRSSTSGVVGEEATRSSGLSSQPPRLFSVRKGEENAAAATAATAAANGQVFPSNASSSSTISLPLLPPDFDWRLYLAYNPDLRAAGAFDASSAAAHFLSRGRKEGRPASKLSVSLRYTACTGLINQHYSHVAALSLASVLGTEVRREKENDREREIRNKKEEDLDFKKKPQNSKKSGRPPPRCPARLLRPLLLDLRRPQRGLLDSGPLGDPARRSGADRDLAAGAGAHPQGPSLDLSLPGLDLAGDGLPGLRQLNRPAGGPTPRPFDGGEGQ